MDKMSRLSVLCAAWCVAFACSAAERISSRAFVILRPEASSFWVTATNSSMSVPVVFPKGSKSAKLEIAGDAGDYRAIYTVECEESESMDISFTLPEPNAPRQENVYSLTLTFDDEKTVRTAKLAVVQGLKPGAEGSTRCASPYGTSEWQKVYGRAVLPILYGMDSFMINGTTVDTGLNGAQGWYALDGVKPGETVSLSVGAEDLMMYGASLKGAIAGMFIHVR
jgi:hypothetical protein